MRSQIKAKSNDTLISQKGYSEVNGINMYYEIYGQDKPLVLIHGGGSTIQTTFGRVIPMLARHRRLTPEHAIEMHRQIANSELAIIPGVHGEYIEEIATLKSNSKEAEFVIPMIESFLDKASLI